MYNINNLFVDFGGYASFFIILFAILSAFLNKNLYISKLVSDMYIFKNDQAAELKDDS